MEEHKPDRKMPKTALEAVGPGHALVSFIYICFVVSACKSRQFGSASCLSEKALVSFYANVFFFFSVAFFLPCLICLDSTSPFPFCRAGRQSEPGPLPAPLTLTLTGSEGF